MTPSQVEIRDNRLELRPRELVDGRMSGGATVQIPDGLTATVEEVELTDRNLRRVWGTLMNRIVLKADQPGTSGTWDLRITLLAE
jgi:hypothetical protein